MASRVMVIDDSETDLLYTQIVLQRCGADFEVHVCETAREALETLRAGTLAVDLILLDINMPGMDGFEFLDAYGRIDAARQAPCVVVMLTSSPDPADRQRALAHPAVRDYVTKPLDLGAAAGLARLLEA